MEHVLAPGSAQNERKAEFKWRMFAMVVDG